MCTLAIYFFYFDHKWMGYCHSCILRSYKCFIHSFMCTCHSRAIITHFFPLVEWWIATFHKAIPLFILYNLHGRCFIFWSAHYPFEREESQRRVKAFWREAKLCVSRLLIHALNMSAVWGGATLGLNINNHTVVVIWLTTSSPDRDSDTSISSASLKNIRI